MSSPVCGMKRIKGISLHLFFITSFWLIFSPLAFGSNLLTVTFLDVGEGDAIFIETPQSDTILIDAGNPMTGSLIVDFLNRKGVNRLTSLFITHPHPDHMGGIFQILPRFDIGTIYDNGQPIADLPNNDLYRWYKESVRTANYKPVAAGDVFQYGNVTISVLWPKSAMSGNWNENSLVLKIVYGKTAFLLMGDANTFVEKALLNEAVDLKAQVLKVGHHGAQDATSREFLEAVAPAYAVISVNDRNVRGYPAVEVTKRLKNKGIKTFLTYRSGNIVFTLNHHEKLHISVSKSSVNGY